MTNYSKLIYNERNVISKYIYHSSEQQQMPQQQQQHLSSLPPLPHHHHQQQQHQTQQTTTGPMVSNSSSIHSFDSDYSSSSDSNLNDVDSLQSQPAPQPCPLSDNLPIKFMKVRGELRTTTTMATTTTSAPGNHNVASLSSNTFKYYTQFLNSIPHFSELKPALAQRTRSFRSIHHHNAHPSQIKPNKPITYDLNAVCAKKQQQAVPLSQQQKAQQAQQTQAKTCSLVNRNTVLECGESTSLKKTPGIYTSN